MDEEYYGSAEKVALMRKSAALYRLLRDDPRFSYYGRLVALSRPDDDLPELLTALARLQGAGIVYYMPKASTPALLNDLARRGLTTDRYELMRGGTEAVEMAQDIRAAHPLPPDLEVVRLDAATPSALIAATAGLCEACGVMPVPGAVMRGVARQGISLVACDRTGAPVANASSFVLHHPRNPRSGDVFWGMLATREDRRGAKLALALGAMAIVHMAETHGASGFITGVKASNAASRALCARVGVTDTEWTYASAVDPGAMPSGSITA